MSDALSAAQQARLKQLLPTAFSHREGASHAVDALLDAESARRGAPERISGAFHALALREGDLLKEEFDLSTHAHHDGWRIGAVVVDPVELILVNQDHGFEGGDLALAAMFRAMKQVCPSSKVVRTHSDGFAVLLGPTAEQRVSVELLAALREALPSEVARALPGVALKFTLGLLELTVANPSHWQVLGPLVWAECERALVIARRAPWSGVLARRIDLDGTLPELETGAA